MDSPSRFHPQKRTCCLPWSACQQSTCRYCKVDLAAITNTHWTYNFVITCKLKACLHADNIAPVSMTPDEQDCGGPCQLQCIAATAQYVSLQAEFVSDVLLHAPRQQANSSPVPCCAVRCTILTAVSALACRLSRSMSSSSA
jgi:hypothetical protein